MASLQIDSETASANGPVDIGESDRSTVANAGDNGDCDGDLGFDHPRYTLWRFALPYWHYGLAGFIGGGLLTMRVRMVIFTHILPQEVGWFDTHQTAELASQLESDAKAVQVVAGQR